MYTNIEANYLRGPGLLVDLRTIPDLLSSWK